MSREPVYIRGIDPFSHEEAAKAEPCIDCGALYRSNRPYGPGRSYLCFPCAHAPHRIAETERILSGSHSCKHEPKETAS